MNRGGWQSCGGRRCGEGGGQVGAPSRSRGAQVGGEGIQEHLAPFSSCSCSASTWLCLFQAAGQSQQPAPCPLGVPLGALVPSCSPPPRSLGVLGGHVTKQQAGCRCWIDFLQAIGGRRGGHGHGAHRVLGFGVSPAAGGARGAAQPSFPAAPEEPANSCLTK